MSNLPQLLETPSADCGGTASATQRLHLLRLNCFPPSLNPAHPPARLVHQCKYPLRLDPCPPLLPPWTCATDRRRVRVSPSVCAVTLPLRLKPLVHCRERDPQGPGAQLISADPPVVRVNSLSSSEPMPGHGPSVETSLRISLLCLGQIGRLEGEAGTGIPGME